MNCGRVVCSLQGHAMLTKRTPSVRVESGVRETPRVTGKSMPDLSVNQEASALISMSNNVESPRFSCFGHNDVQLP